MHPGPLRCARQVLRAAYADAGAVYSRIVEIDVAGLVPLISRPGHPEDVVAVRDVAGTKIDSVFIGSCTNGRFEDLATAADLLKGRRVAPGVVLKIVPATRRVWKRALDEGLIDIFLEAGALVGNAGCAGCAAGQIGQNGPGEVTVSTGNRNFAGKQGQGRSTSHHPRRPRPRPSPASSPPRPTSRPSPSCSPAAPPRPARSGPLG